MEWLQAVAKEYGLFVALVVYVLYEHKQTVAAIKAENRERESKYIAVIEKLSESFQTLEVDVKAIKEKLWGK